MFSFTRIRIFYGALVIWGLCAGLIIYWQGMSDDLWLALLFMLGMIVGAAYLLDLLIWSVSGDPKDDRWSEAYSRRQSEIGRDNLSD